MGDIVSHLIRARTAILTLDSLCELCEIPNDPTASVWISQSQYADAIKRGLARWRNKETIHCPPTTNDSSRAQQEVELQDYITKLLRDNPSYMPAYRTVVHGSPRDLQTETLTYVSYLAPKVKQGWRDLSSARPGSTVVWINDDYHSAKPYVTHYGPVSIFNSKGQVIPVRNPSNMETIIHDQHVAWVDDPVYVDERGNSSRKGMVAWPW